MKKKKKEYFIIITLGIVFLLMVGRFIFRIFPSSRTRKGSRVKKEKKDQYSLKPLKGEEINKQLKKLEWNRDPFYLNRYITNKAPKKKERKKSSQKELELTGIIWDEDNPMAVISGEILEKNESYGAYKVEKIKKNKVILINKEEGKKKILEMR